VHELRTDGTAVVFASFLGVGAIGGRRGEGFRWKVLA